ncbi:HAD-IA family hydrolase [Mesobacterium pallidum]|uniref:HAD-IA family hydrolase n=1 Tax=Mesobacterium pallidum TaxID=2872037 RepID=UPI001EE2BEC9|nr:HAD-IA family hydrolase [Mesobacterium pallidum]
MGTVIFDLDGTLADTSGDLLAAANHCFRGMGLGDLLGPGDAGVALRGGKAMLRAGLTRAGRLDEDVIERWYPELLSAYGEALDVHTVLYPGAMESIARMAGDGFNIGICTNKPEALAEELLRRLGIRDAFASMVGADTLPVRKPDPEPLREAARRAGGDPARCLLVGDSITDRDTARNAGVPCVLVGFGPAGGDMAALEPEAIIAHFDELPEVAARLLEV